jgi:hypothetical protein
MNERSKERGDNAQFESDKPTDKPSEHAKRIRAGVQ